MARRVLGAGAADRGESPLAVEESSVDRSARADSGHTRARSAAAAACRASHRRGDADIGAFATFTYLRPFLETTTHATLPQLSLLLLGLGAAGFVGTYAATALLKHHLHRLLGGLPLGLAAVTLAMLAGGHVLWMVALTMFLWGALNSAVPVSWLNWLTLGVHDEPEAGGGLMVAAIQLAIMLGAAFGGLLLDHISIAATLIGGAALLGLASAAVGNGRRLTAAQL